MFNIRAPKRYASDNDSSLAVETRHISLNRHFHVFAMAQHTQVLTIKQNYAKVSSANKGSAKETKPKVRRFDYKKKIRKMLQLYIILLLTIMRVNQWRQ